MYVTTAFKTILKNSLLWKWHRPFPNGQVIDALCEVSMQSKKFTYGFMEIPIKLWFIYTIKWVRLNL